MLADDDLLITESAAICQYMAEKYGNGALLPQLGTASSAIYNRLTSFIIAGLEQPLWIMGKHKFALPEDKRCRAILSTAQWEFEQAVAIAKSWITEDEFFTGEQLTVADILLTQTLNWALKFEQVISPKLDAFRQRLSKRPAMNTAIAKERAAEEK